MGELLGREVSYCGVSAYHFSRKVVIGAQAQQIHGRELEEKVATILVKGWKLHL